MRFTTLILFLLGAAPVAAQTVVLSEDFSGAVPPPGWLHVNNNGNPTNGWIPGVNGFDGNFVGRAWHDDESIADSDNTLVSPILDFSGMTNVFLHFESETYYSNFLANHPNSVGDGVSTLEITTNGGSSWTVVWTDTAIDDNILVSPTVDLSNWAGQSNIQLGIHLYGTYDQSWAVDNVIIDDQAVPVLTTLTNPFNGHPYFLLGQSDFQTAQAKAIELGGSLVSIDTVDENNWIRANLSNYGGTQRNLMLGLNDVNLEGTFVWDSGEALVYTNWAPGEPNNGAGGEDFVEMVSGGQWNDFDGSGAHAVVEISQPTIRSTPLVAGELGTITVSGMRVDAEIILVFSTNGNGPYSGRYGVMDVDPDLFTPRFPAINGGFNFSTYIPGALTGATLWGQGVQFNPDGSTELTAPFETQIQ